MKKIIFITSLFASAIALKAQTVEEGIRQLYYERYASAENTFHQVLAKDPGNAGAWFRLTETYLLEKNIKQAADSLQLAPANIHSDPYFNIAQGAVLLANGKKEEASAYMNAALKDTKEKNADVLSAVARIHLLSDQGDPSYAINLLNKAIKRDKHNPGLYVSLGNAYRKIADGSESYKAYQQALEENPNYAAALHNLGEIFLTQKNAELYLDYFKKAVTADPQYAPSIYRLYAYEFYHDPAKALNYYKDYATKSDPSIQNAYDMADLYYLNKQYDQAISIAKEITNHENVKPRVNKLLSYSYAAIGDTTQAIGFMQKYFDKEADSNLISKDYFAMGEYYFTQPGYDSLATTYIEKGITLEKDSATLYELFKKMATLSNQKKDFAGEALWLQKYNAGNAKANNLDLFNWGLALYRAEDYVAADTVFGLYVAKYPEQSFGYYWQAKSKALQDRDMKTGLAVPAYEKLIQVLEKDTADANYKKWIVDAYGYLAAYEVNTQMDYAQAVDYFEKVLEVDPENENARKYIAMLEKNTLSKTDE
jgi:tetratricopeptide (TPR) repeat protein